MSPFNRNLKRLRIERGMKQEELAQRMHVSRQTVSGWETGRRQPDLDTLKQLAEVLDADIHELIYGSKPGEYSKFQRKYVVRTVLCGGFVAVVLLFRLLVWPYLKVMYYTHHWGLPLTISYALFQQGHSFAFGSLIPSAIRLFVPVSLEKKWAVCCLIGGAVLILPTLLTWLGVGFWSRWIVYPVGNALLSYILPFLSGICIALGLPWQELTK